MYLLKECAQERSAFVIRVLTIGVFCRRNVFMRRICYERIEFTGGVCLIHILYTSVFMREACTKGVFMRERVYERSE
jgi:hypothetical protein